MEFWWKDRAWRIVQTNMREIDMADMQADVYVEELKKFNANTVIINTGGIIANYDTKLPYHTKNPYMTGDTLKEVIAACQQEDIRVCSRVDFSKVRLAVYAQHPEWAYVSPKGEIIDYHGNIHVCFNSEYQQQHSIDIMREIVAELDPDGFFTNMEGYTSALDYSRGWQGICQCENCQKRFFDMYGETLPKVEDESDPVYQKYKQFQAETIAEFNQNIRQMMAEIKPDLLFFHYNIFRFEAGTSFMIPKFNDHYKMSELLKTKRNTYRGKEVTGTSVDFLDITNRLTAVSPYQQELRMAQSLANGGHVDYYMIGRLDTHSDKSGFDKLRGMFKYHKDHEEDYRFTRSTAQIALVKPTANFFAGDLSCTDEYWGWYYLLSQQHHSFTCLEESSLKSISLDAYQTIILPGYNDLDKAGIDRLDAFVENGGTLIATGTKPEDQEGVTALRSLGISKTESVEQNMRSAYFILDDKTKFPHYEKTDLVYVPGVYGYAQYQDGVQKYARLIPPHYFAPPESAYYTEISDYPMITVNQFGAGRGVYLPWTPGTAYYSNGFSNIGNVMADLLEHVLDIQPLGGDIPPMVEVTHRYSEKKDVQYVHLVNGTGFFLKSYFEVAPLSDLFVEVPKPDWTVHSVRDMVTGTDCRFEVADDKLRIEINEMALFCALKID